MTKWNINPDTPLDEIWARFTSDTATERAAITNDLFIEIYGKTHLCPFFGTVGGITSARAADYIRKRMASVFSRTVKKELSALRTCLSWCEEKDYVDTAPIIPRPPRRALGTPFKQRRRGKATEVSLGDVRAVINELPEWSESRKVSRFPIRSRMIVAFETALRPATLDKLSIPEHFTRGAATLTITDAIDKARFGRQLPLSDETRAVLDNIIPESGLISRSTICATPASRSSLRPATCRASPSSLATFRRPPRRDTSTATAKPPSAHWQSPVLPASALRPPTPLARETV